MKVLFLDVDGVLNTTKSNSLYSLSKPLLRRLSEIQKETGCEIVVSSTWRKSAHMMKILARRLAYRGIHLLDTTIGYNGRTRGEEIQGWLDDHDWSRYAILDDDGDMLLHQREHFFQTDPDYGLTETIKYRVIHHLGT